MTKRDWTADDDICLDWALRESGKIHKLTKDEEELIKDIAYLCAGCAKDKGLTWRSKGHAATIHSGTCDVCGKEKALACINDYKLPSGKTLGAWD